jgi:hypothetical protein
MKVLVQKFLSRRSLLKKSLRFIMKTLIKGLFKTITTVIKNIFDINLQFKHHFLHNHYKYNHFRGPYYQTIILGVLYNILYEIYKEN